MTLDPSSLSVDDREALVRWRLALGSDAESDEACPLCLSSLAADGAVDLPAHRVEALEEALDFVYGGKNGSADESRPYIPQWLAALRGFFSHEVIALVQRDAIECKGLTQLLFEPETLPQLEKNVALVATLMAARDLVPDRARDIARQIVAEVVAALRERLETEVRTTLLGALRRDRHSPMRLLRNLDWTRTLRRNLKGWDRERQRLVVEHLYFWANQRRRHAWDVVLVVDQSASMAESVVYSTVMAAIFASLDVLRTRLVLFDTTVVDMTPLLTDPVDILFAAQLGGGTDIAQAVAYAHDRFVERPEKTLFILISDLEEGGSPDRLVARFRQLVESRVKALCLLALSDEGRPSFDHALARSLEDGGVPCFGCTPHLLVTVMERLLRGEAVHPPVAEWERFQPQVTGG